MTSPTARIDTPTLNRLIKLLETTCGHCEYDEAEGDLFAHCDRCCRNIVTDLYDLVHEQLEMG